MDLSFLENLHGSYDLSSLQSLEQECQKKWHKGHGPRLKEVLKDLPNIPCQWKFQNGVVEISSSEITEEQNQIIFNKTKQLKNWKKGPYKLFNFSIDAEWRCDFKWQRLQEKLPSLESQVVLDIGSNNGYYLYPMLKAGAKFVLGIDPTLHFKAQFDFIKHFSTEKKLEMKMWGVEHLNFFKNCFDTIFSMGILYHHRSPIQQLVDMREAMKPGGLLVLETIGIPGETPHALTPLDRYAGMKNIYFLPSLPCLENWLHKAKFTDIEIVSQDWQGTEEQRSTEWTSEVSYQNFLNPENSSLTIEGHPSPRRFILFAKKKK